MKSQRIIQIALILREVKDTIYSKALREEDINDDEFAYIVKTSIKKVASQLNLKSYTTCSDKVTRQLGIRIDQFIDELKQFLTENCLAIDTSLGIRIISNRTQKDNIQEIGNILFSVKNN